MMTPKSLVSLAAASLFAFSMNADAFTTPCIYQQYKCGYTMVTDYGTYSFLPSTSICLVTSNACPFPQQATLFLS